MQRFKVFQKKEIEATYSVLADNQDAAERMVEFRRVDDMCRLSYKEENTVTARNWRDDDNKLFTIIGTRGGKLEIHYLASPNAAYALDEAKYAKPGDFKEMNVLEGHVEQC